MYSGVRNIAQGVVILWESDSIIRILCSEEYDSDTYPSFVEIRVYP